MTPFAFAVLGFVAAVIVIGILVEAEARHLDAVTPPPYPPETDGIDVPAWVNDGRPLEQRFIEAVDVALWEAELFKHEDQDT